LEELTTSAFIFRVDFFGLLHVPGHLNFYHHHCENLRPCSEKLHNSKSPLDIVRLIKSMKIGYAELATHMIEKRTMYKVLFRIPEEDNW
jgi:hypothetical protein